MGLLPFLFGYKHGKKKADKWYKKTKAAKQMAELEAAMKSPEAWKRYLARNKRKKK